VAWGLIHSFYPLFAVPDALTKAVYEQMAKQCSCDPGSTAEPDKARQALLTASAALQKEWQAAEARVDRYNAIAVLGCVGASVAGAMAAGEGWARRCWKPALLGFFGCALVGVGLGGIAGWMGQFVYAVLRDASRTAVDLWGTTLVQTMMLATLGGSVGLALAGLTTRGNGFAACLLGGALAGAMAGLVYPITAAWFFPYAKSELFIPQEDTALFLWLGLTAVLLGAMIPGFRLRRGER
jgi:hypothetical protein